MESNRMATWWIKWEDLNWPIPDNVEKVKRRAEEFAKANISAAIIFGTRDGWRNFDEEYKRFSSHFDRTESSPCGDDTMLMYFTSGTSGYPKIAAHNYKCIVIFLFLC